MESGSAEVHLQFAKRCFSQAQAAILRKFRPLEEGEEILALSFASFYHWSQTPEFDVLQKLKCYILISKAFALFGDGDKAIKYGNQCLEICESANASGELYAMTYQALLLGAFIAGQVPRAMDYFRLSNKYANQMADEESSDASRATTQAMMAEHSRGC